MRMFEPLSKSRAGVDADRPKAGMIGDLSGAFADLGTFLPLVIGLLVVGQIEPTGLLVGFGLFAVLTGLIFRLPIPVQPMKLVAALAIAGSLGASSMAACGMMLGMTFLLLGAFGAFAWRSDCWQDRRRSTGCCWCPCRWSRLSSLSRGCT